MKYYLVLAIFLFVKTSKAQESFGELKDCVYPLVSIEEEDTSYADLEFLNEKLKDKNVVFLGEGQHGLKADGRIHLRLVKYLHKKQGFDLLLTEQNFYDFLQLNNAIKGSGNLDDSISKYLDNWLRENTFTLIQYVHQCKSNGEDFLIGGVNIYNNCRNSVMCPFSFLKMNHSMFADNEHIKRLESVIENGIVDEKGLNTSLEFLKEHSLNKSFFDNDSLNNLWLQIYKNILVDHYYTLHPLKKSKDESGAYYKYRDSVMADNVKFYRNLYKDRKIVVITSTYHITKGRKDFIYLSDEIFGQNVKPMGEYIYEDSTNRIYSIINLFNEGHVKKNIILRNGSNILPKRDKRSLEYKLKSLNYKTSFVDLHQLSANGDSIFYMYPFYTEKLKDKWSDIYDGAIYMEKSGPSEVKEFYNVIYKDGEWQIRWK